MLWSVIIAVLTLMPASLIDALDLWRFMSIDKIGHFLMYTVYTFLLVLTFSKKSKESNLPGRIFLKSVMLAIGFGIIMEFLHGIIPERKFDHIDLIANIIGAIAGLGLYKFFVNINPVS